MPVQEQCDKTLEKKVPRRKGKAVVVRPQVEVREFVPSGSESDEDTSDGEYIVVVQHPLAESVVGIPPGRVRRAEDRRATVQHALGVTNADPSGGDQAQVQAQNPVYYVPLNDSVDTESDQGEVSNDLSVLQENDSADNLERISDQGEVSDQSVLLEDSSADERELISDQGEVSGDQSGSVENDMAGDIELTSDPGEMTDTEAVDSVSESGSVGELEETILGDSSATSYETPDDFSTYETPDESWVESSPNTSFSSGSNSPVPFRPATVRRSARNVGPPTLFTYDKIGTPVVYTHKTPRPKR